MTSTDPRRPRPSTSPWTVSSTKFDLAGQNAEELRDLLTRFVEAGRRTSVTKQVPAVRRLAPAADTKAVRAWADDNGIEVNSRGRIKGDVVERYPAPLS